MSDPKECRYCRTIVNGSDEPCRSLVAAKDCPWMSASDWKVLDASVAAASAEPVAWRWRWKGVIGNNPWRVIGHPWGGSFITAEVEPLYTHPAPDAELVAALEELLHVRGTSEDTPAVADRARAALTKLKG